VVTARIQQLEAFVGNLRISPDAAFSVNATAFAIFMVVIGRIEGPIVGALILWALDKYLSDDGTWYLIGLGMLAHRRHDRLQAGALGLRPAALTLAPLSSPATTASLSLPPFNSYRSSPCATSRNTTSPRRSSAASTAAATRA
jgi:hypothetical protein